MTGGRCRCGRVTYRVEANDAPLVYACHCLDCQRWSGSAFTLNVLIPNDAIAVSGTLTSYAYNSASGATSVHYFCSECHARIYNTNASAPGLAILRAGTLTGSHLLVPVAHIWTKRMQPWLKLATDVAAFEGSPTPEEFARAASGG
jgi:hypothetical protein